MIAVPRIAGETVGFVLSADDDVAKCVVAFANCSGGVLYIGVDPDGVAVGVDDAASLVVVVDDFIREAIRPDISPFFKTSVVKLDGKIVIQVDVESGTNRPYYLVDKGMTPEGVFLRKGAVSVPATNLAIRTMIRDMDGESFEARRSINQDLTFEVAKGVFTERKVMLGVYRMMTLGLMSSDRVYTNLALLLSDQCTHTIKILLFQDASQHSIVERHEFGGSLFKQLADVFNFLGLDADGSPKDDDGAQTVERDFPAAAVREALLNAVVHREYATNGTTLVKVFSDRMEVISPGGLISWIGLEDIMSGFSDCRNFHLASVFSRLQFIEAHGSGIFKIFDAYRSYLAQPRFEVSPNVFKLILPKTGMVSISNEDLSQEEKVLKFVHERGSVNRKQAESILGISQTAAGIVLRRMVDNGDLARDGHSRNIRYFLP